MQLRRNLSIYDALCVALAETTELALMTFATCLAKAPAVMCRIVTAERLSRARTAGASASTLRRGVATPLEGRIMFKKLFELLTLKWLWDRR